MSLHGQSKAAAAGGAFERLLVVASGPVKLALPAPIVQGMLPLGEAGIKDVTTVRGITYRVTSLAGRWEGMPSTAPCITDGPCLTGDIIELEVIDAERAE